MGRQTLKVRLLVYTPDPDRTVAMGSRLCYSDEGIDEVAEKIRKKDQTKYIERLMSYGHLSPVEHASFTFGVEGVSRSLLAQITRHRLASFSVKSQRYVGSVKGEGDVFSYILPPAIEALGEEEASEFDRQMGQIQAWYNAWVQKLQDAGQGSDAFEDARFVLPNAAETKLIVTMNARELMHFFQLRCCNRAQWEIRELAWQMLEQVREVAPALFCNAGPSCVDGPCPEGKMSCKRMEEVRARHSALNKKHGER